MAPNVRPGQNNVVITKPYGDRDIASPGKAIIEYYNPQMNKAFAYEGDIFIHKEYAPGALRDNVFLVKAYDDNQIYEISLHDIDRFEVRCQVCTDQIYCCSDLEIILRDGGTMRGELYSDGPFAADSTNDANLETKPYTEFGLKTERGIVKLIQQSGVRMANPDLNANLNCGFCNSHFGRIVACTMEWSQEYKRKQKLLRK
jgi:hypothetical protein